MASHRRAASMEAPEPSSMESTAMKSAATMESTSLRRPEATASKLPAGMKRTAVHRCPRSPIDAICVVLAHGVVLSRSPSHGIPTEVMVVIQVPVSIPVSGVAVEWRSPHAPR